MLTRLFSRARRADLLAALAALAETSLTRALGLPALIRRRQVAVVLGYVAASAVYIAIGVWLPDFLFSVIVAVAYLLVVAWLVPAVVRRLL